MWLDPSNQKEMRRYATLAQVGMEIVAPAALGLILDVQFNWSPWGLIVGTFLGFAGGVTHLIRLSNAAEETGPTRSAAPKNQEPERK